MDGAADGILFFFYKKDWREKLGQIKTWSTAATQVLFSLGLGGNQLNTSTTNDFHYNTLCHTMIISIVNSVASLLSVSVVFAILGFLGKLSGVGIDQLATGNIEFYVVVVFLITYLIITCTHLLVYHCHKPVL